jgi:galactokinase
MTTQELQDRFRQNFGRAPTVIATAPGRVEFIGNHTDYNGGAVLGAAIDRYVTVAAAPDGQGRLRFATGDGPVVVLPAGATGKATGGDSWVNYPLGVWRSLGDLGVARPADFDLLITSDLPAGAGLSSSAALELATALALHALAGGPALEPAQLATIGKHAENVHVGMPCGILDQGTSAFGQANHLVHIDCRGPSFKRIPMPAGTHLWIFNTHEKHALVDGLYATRHKECHDAAAALGVQWLADVPVARIEELEKKLPPASAKRFRHVVAEHARVAATVASLKRGDLARVGSLLTESHVSSSRYFENSTPALDSLVDLLAAQPGVLGARLTGGGFGGAAMALTTDAFTAAAAQAVADAQAAKGHHRPDVIHLQVADGARIVWQG